MNRVTRNDVAKRAGVSPALVSYVINRTKPVSEEKTQAVMRAIEELHYRPNLHARSLRTNKSMQIAFVCDNLRNDWMEIPEQLFMEKGYFVSHCYSRDSDDFIRMLIDGQFDGVFMMSNRYSADQLNTIAKEGIPIVLYKTRDYSHLEPGIAAVAPNICDAVKKTVNYLALRGHRRMILAPPLRYRVDLVNGFRERAYREAVIGNGLDYDENLICVNTQSLDTIYSSVFDLLCVSRREERPTAIIAGEDYLAGHLMMYLGRLGFSVPGDVAVVGMDNRYLAEMMSPQLSTVDFSKERFSVSLVDSMLELIGGGDPGDIYIDVSLIVRDST